MREISYFYWELRVILILKLEFKVVVTKMVGGGLWRPKGATTPVNF